MDALRLLNRIIKPLAGHIPAVALLETRGRRSGSARRTPVSDALDGDTFWIVAEHGRQAAYVRNIMADPHVRVRVRGRWRTGTAHLLPDDDPLRRLRRHPLLTAPFVRLMGSELLTIRIDLDPLPIQKESVQDALVAGAVAGVVSGIPSTLWALVGRRHPLEPTRAAGTLLTAETSPLGLVAYGGAAHLILSLGWALVLSRVLPRRATAAWGAVAGMAIGAIDLLFVGRRYPRVRALPLLPQMADHAAYGATVGWILQGRGRPSRERG